jgi:hypothetical protein
MWLSASTQSADSLRGQLLDCRREPSRTAPTLGYRNRPGSGPPAPPAAAEGCRQLVEALNFCICWTSTAGPRPPTVARISASKRTLPILRQALPGSLAATTHPRPLPPSITIRAGSHACTRRASARASRDCGEKRPASGSASRGSSATMAARSGAHGRSRRTDRAGSMT